MEIIQNGEFNNVRADGTSTYHCDFFIFDAAGKYDWPGFSNLRNMDVSPPVRCGNEYIRICMRVVGCFER